jgi:hypothetical protein
VERLDSGDALGAGRDLVRATEAHEESLSERRRAVWEQQSRAAVARVGGYAPHHEAECMAAISTCRSRTENTLVNKGRPCMRHLPGAI